MSTYTVGTFGSLWFAPVVIVPDNPDNEQHITEMLEGVAKQIADTLNEEISLANAEEYLPLVDKHFEQTLTATMDGVTVGFTVVVDVQAPEGLVVLASTLGVAHALFERLVQEVSMHLSGPNYALQYIIAKSPMAAAVALMMDDERERGF